MADDPEHLLRSEPALVEQFAQRRFEVLAVPFAGPAVDDPDLEVAGHDEPAVGGVHAAAQLAVDDGAHLLVGLLARFEFEPGGGELVGRGVRDVDDLAGAGPDRDDVGAAHDEPRTS